MFFVPTRYTTLRVLNNRFFISFEHCDAMASFPHSLVVDERVAVSARILPP